MSQVQFRPERRSYTPSIPRDWHGYPPVLNPPEPYTRYTGHPPVAEQIKDQVRTSSGMTFGVYDSDKRRAVTMLPDDAASKPDPIPARATMAAPAADPFPTGPSGKRKPRGKQVGKRAARED